MSKIFTEELIDWDEIVEINFVGYEDTIDINVDNDHLFWANNLLTHNSAADEIEFSQSNIAGGISKIYTADNVFGIFTSRALREQGKYQLQLMKTRSSSGVGLRIDLGFNVDTLRIIGLEPGVESINPVSSVLEKIKSGHRILQTQPPITQPSTSIAASTNPTDKLKILLQQLKNKE